MSYITFIASDLPMGDVENPYVKQLSINEALAINADVPGFLLDSAEIDRDDTSVILWVDSEDGLGDIRIKSGTLADFLSDNGFLPVTNLQYFSSLEWQYTEKRAKRLISLIREHLKKADAAEIWHIWLGTEVGERKQEVRGRYVHADELIPDDFEKMVIGGLYDCIAVRRA